MSNMYSQPPLFARDKWGKPFEHRLFQSGKLHIYFPDDGRVLVEFTTGGRIIPWIELTTRQDRVELIRALVLGPQPVTRREIWGVDDDKPALDT